MRLSTSRSKHNLCAPALAASLFAASLAPSASAQTAPEVFQASGAAKADIQGVVDAYRAALGNLNPNVAGSFPNGRREINWDGVPDALSAPNNFPPNFFNKNSPRGAVFFSPANTFQVSAKAGIAPIEFDNLQPGLSSLFATFSPQRLFTAFDPRTETLFFVPGSNVPATTSGFGAIFTDVDRGDSTKIEFLDAEGTVLWSGFVPKANGNETFSFLGVKFEGNPLFMVRITVGGNQDVSVMDDFIYGEPQPVSAN